MQSSAAKYASAQTRGVNLLHLILLGMGVLVALIFLVLVRWRGPLLIPDSSTPVLAYAFAGIGLTVAAFAILLVRPRIPARASGEALNDYWGNGAVRGRALLLWILCENAGIVSGVGYLLTGDIAALVSMAIALAALAWFSPARIADEA